MEDSASTEQPAPRAKASTPFPHAELAIVGERTRALGIALAYEAWQLAGISGELIKAKRIAELDKIDAEGLALLILVALLRPIPQNTVHFADALSAARPSFITEPGQYPRMLPVAPEVAAKAPSLISRFAELLRPETKLYELNVGIEKFRGEIVATVSLHFEGLTELYSAPIVMEPFANSGHTHYTIGFSGEILGAVATIFDLKPPVITSGEVH